MYWQRGRLLLGSEFDDVRVSNRYTAEINDAAVNVGKGSGCDSPLSEFIAEKQPVEFRFPEAASRASEPSRPSMEIGTRKFVASLRTVSCAVQELYLFILRSEVPAFIVGVARSNAGSSSSVVGTAIVSPLSTFLASTRSSLSSPVIVLISQLT